MKAKYMMKKAAAIGMAALMLIGCGKINPDATVVTINGGEDTISLGYANFIAHYNQAGYDIYYRSYFGDEYWSEDLYGDGSTMEERVKSDAMDAMEEAYLSRQHADEYDVTVSAEDEKAITQAAKTFLEENSDEAIEQIGATQEYVEDMLTYQTYLTRMQQALRDEADTTVTDEESIQSTILYTKFDNAVTTDDEGNSVTLTEDEIAAAKASADAVAAADDFEATVDAEGGTSSSYSYTASEDPAEDATLPEEVMTAAMALSDGETSEVIDVADDAYYVVYMEATHDEEATADKVTELEEEKADDHYTEVMDDWKEDITWEIDEKQWAKVTFEELFEYMEVETEDATDESGDDATTEEDAMDESDDGETSEEASDDTTESDAGTDESTDAE